MTHEAYIVELQAAIQELVDLSSLLNIKFDINNQFYVSGGNTRHICDANHGIICGPPLIRLPDPLATIRRTLDVWKCIRPPDELHVNGRRMLWDASGYGWLDLGEVPK